MLVVSKAMREVKYEPSSRTLRIRFADVGWWRYFDVPAETYKGLISAESHGRYFHEHVRARFRCRRD